jgi:hypothetical protein
MTKRYAHPNKARLKAEMEKFGPNTILGTDSHKSKLLVASLDEDSVEKSYT